MYAIRRLINERTDLNLVTESSDAALPVYMACSDLADLHITHCSVSPHILRYEVDSIYRDKISLSVYFLETSLLHEYIY